MLLLRDSDVILITLASGVGIFVLEFLILVFLSLFFFFYLHGLKCLTMVRFDQIIFWASLFGILNVAGPFQPYLSLDLGNYLI